MEAAAQQQATAQGVAGVFQMVVKMGGNAITVVGNVINGVVRIGTFYI